ncbi:hypothetical protein RCL70_00430 [Escherichia marmotae]|nr:hypothetical protein [Escherichia marmotae]
MTETGYTPEKKPEYRLPEQTGIKGVFFLLQDGAAEKQSAGHRLSALAWLGLAWLGLAWLGLAWLGNIVMLGLIKRNNIHKKI